MSDWVGKKTKMFFIILGRLNFLQYQHSLDDLESSNELKETIVNSSLY